MRLHDVLPPPRTNTTPPPSMVTTTLTTPRNGLEYVAHPHCNVPTITRIDTGVNRRRPRLPHAPRVRITSRDSISTIISAQEGPSKVKRTTTMMTTMTMTMMTTVGVDMVMLCCSALGRSRGRILGKESVEGRCKQAGRHRAGGRDDVRDADDQRRRRHPRSFRHRRTI